MHPTIACKVQVALHAILVCSTVYCTCAGWHRQSAHRLPDHTPVPLVKCSTLGLQDTLTSQLLMADGSQADLYTQPQFAETRHRSGICAWILLPATLAQHTAGARAAALPVSQLGSLTTAARLTHHTRPSTLLVPHPQAARPGGGISGLLRSRVPGPVPRRVNLHARPLVHLHTAAFCRDHPDSFVLHQGAKDGSRLVILADLHCAHAASFCWASRGCVLLLHVPTAGQS